MSGSSGNKTTNWESVARSGVHVAGALSYAQKQEVLHRDIKPANLLLDGRGNLWVTDFGLAHCQSQAGLTMTGDLVGTLRYMSPEQALAKRVIVDHREVHLTPTEYELLRVLATNPDRVLTHGYLLKSALGSGYEDALDNLRTFIAQLRRKLEREPSRPRWILTEPAVGYRFRPEP